MSNILKYRHINQSVIYKAKNQFVEKEGDSLHLSPIFTWGKILIFL
jgi:hypothetical protein